MDVIGAPYFLGEAILLGKPYFCWGIIIADPIQDDEQQRHYLVLLENNQEARVLEKEIVI